MMDAAEGDLLAQPHVHLVSLLFSISRLLFTEALTAMKDIVSDGNENHRSWVSYVCENGLEGKLWSCVRALLIPTGWMLLDES